jgi:hypothetical protein
MVTEAFGREGKSLTRRRALAVLRYSPADSFFLITKRIIRPSHVGRGSLTSTIQIRRNLYGARKFAAAAMRFEFRDFV